MGRRLTAATGFGAAPNVDDDGGGGGQMASNADPLCILVPEVVVLPFLVVLDFDAAVFVVFPFGVADRFLAAADVFLDAAAAVVVQAVFLLLGFNTSTNADGTTMVRTNTRPV